MDMEPDELGRHSCSDVGPWPLYLGQPPPHASRRKTVDGGVLACVRSWNRPLDAADIDTIANEPPNVAQIDKGEVGGDFTAESDGAPDSPRSCNESDRCCLDDESVNGACPSKPCAISPVQALALAHACCRAEFGRSAFLTRNAVQASLRLVLQSGAEKRAWALRVCRVTLPWVKPCVVDEEFRWVLFRTIVESHGDTKRDMRALQWHGKSISRVSSQRVEPSCLYKYV